MVNLQGMHVLFHLAALALTILVLSRVVPSVRIKSAGTALVVAVVFSVLNFFLGWLVGFFVKVVLFVPAVLTLGLLFLLVPFIVNAVMLWLTDKLLASFEIRAARGLVVSAAAITLVNALFHLRLFESAFQGHTRWV
jgi:putative membrane protein